MRILLVHNYYKVEGGEDTVVKNEKELLETHGHDVVLYTRNNAELDRMTGKQKAAALLSSVYSRHTYREIRTLIQEKRIDIVHVHNTLMLVTPSVYYAALDLGVPVVQTVHNFRLLCPAAVFYRNGHICEDCVEKGLGCSVLHKCYRNSRMATAVSAFTLWIHRLAGVYGKLHYICLTDFNREKLLQLKIISADRIYVKPNFVPEMQVNSVGRKKRQCIFVGRLDLLKGVDLLLRAWNILGSNAPDLLLCGKGPLEEWCKEYIEKENICARLCGYVENSTARKLIAESMALVLPTQWYEGFPVTIAEAFAAGTPVLCSAQGNAGSLVEEGITGFTFQADSPEDIVRALRKLDRWAEPARYQIIETCFRERFSAEANYCQLMKIYSEVLAQNFL